jgi:hypothetical protein
MRVVLISEEAPDSMETWTRDSPLGQALVGARPGDTITYAGPDGEIVAEVLAIQPPDNSEDDLSNSGAARCSHGLLAGQRAGHGYHVQRGGVDVPGRGVAR